jgi:hypothetical protein
MKKFLSKNKKILKYCELIDGVTDLSLAKKHIPQWYKDVPASGYSSIQPSFDSDGNPINTKFSPSRNVKLCMPFFDSLVSGYTIELWCDIYVSNGVDGKKEIKWKNNADTPVKERNPESDMFPTPSGYSKSHFVWILPYSFQTPKGYSLLLTHPLNRLDLPFISLSGIADAEQILSSGNYPFFIKEDFEGIIEAGTPIAQIIPIKIENWKKDRDISLRKSNDLEVIKSSSKFFNYYKKNRWIKKNYE